MATILFNTLMVAMATRTGLEPVASAVTGLRDNQLHQRVIYDLYGVANRQLTYEHEP